MRWAALLLAFALAACGGGTDDDQADYGRVQMQPVDRATAK